MSFESELWQASSNSSDVASFLDAAAAALAAHHPGLCGLRVWQLEQQNDEASVRTVSAGLIDAWSMDCGTPTPALLREISASVPLGTCVRLDALGRPARAVLSRQRYEDRAILVALSDAADGVGILVVTLLDEDTADHETLAVGRLLAGPTCAALRHDERVRTLEMLRQAALAERNSLLVRLNRPSATAEIVGADSGLRLVMKRVEQVAGTDAPVLLLGETGSGKEVIARHLHASSRRRNAPMVRVNCGAIPSELIDSELFGHERGAFTGATGVRQGWFERADGGTLLLDEVGELPLAAQVRLLRVLQDGVITRVGAGEDRQVDVRVVAATHRDLEEMVAQGRFREDLWYRLSVFPIRIPPLRDRPQDIAELASHFALRSAGRVGFPPIAPTADNLRQLAAYAWPGNARELAAVIERAVILGEGQTLDVTSALGATVDRAFTTAVTNALPLSPSPAPTDADADTIVTLDEAMRRHIQRALVHTDGRIEGAEGAAELLAIHPSTLRSRIKKLGRRG
jgi:transcriptional regulator with GAF, ATPase, and Fis domain